MESSCTPPIGRPSLADREKCRLALEDLAASAAAHPDRLSVDGTDIAGRKVVLIADTPKVMTEGNWRVGVFVDEDASDEQFDKLVQVFGGQLGGPMAGLAPLIGEMLGVQRGDRN